MAQQDDLARFAALVKRLEQVARSRPGAYRFRILALAFLGFIFVTLVFIGAAALLGGIVWLGIFVFNHLSGASARAMAGMIKLILVIGIPAALFALVLFFTLLGTLLRLIWFRIPPPGGLELRRGAAPRLFSLVDRLTSNMNTPPIHAIVIDEDFNAGVLQSPRLGLLGWYKNYLVIGMPLLCALSPEQFRAMLAHEFGHVAGSHGRFALWVHSTRLMWGQLLEQLAGDDDEEEHAGFNMLAAFLSWYLPIFVAHDFALRRADEYAADAFAKRFAGAQACADLLVAYSTRRRFLDAAFWPKVKQAMQSREQVAIFSSLAQTLQNPLPPEECRRYLAEALQEETGLADTHPCLKERLRHLGFDGKAPPLPAAMPETAAAHYLGNTSGKIISFLDELYTAMAAG